ncbi:MAG: hypothetical protein HKM24_07510, partial [Gammaproteobacteria bacterium]|nr:hypothetical protein [Gammaproteobacteria bacterium]
QWYTASVDMGSTEFALQADEVETVEWFEPQELQQKIKQNPEDFVSYVTTGLNLFDAT